MYKIKCENWNRRLNLSNRQSLLSRRLSDTGNFEYIVLYFYKCMFNMDIYKQKTKNAQQLDSLSHLTLTSFYLDNNYIFLLFYYFNIY